MNHVLKTAHRPPPTAHLILHASAVVTPTGVALFSGASGAGKSTIAALLSAHTGWPVLADDAVCIWHQDDGWLVEDAGQTLIPTQKRIEHKIPAKGHRAAVWFSISQSPRASSTPMPPSETCRRIIQAWLEVAGHSSPYNSIQAMRMFPAAAALARDLTGHLLEFNLSIDTVNAIGQYTNIQKEQ